MATDAQKNIEEHAKTDGSPMTDSFEILKQQFNCSGNKLVADICIKLTSDSSSSFQAFKELYI